MISGKKIRWLLHLTVIFTRFTGRQFEGMFWGRHLNWKGSRSGPLAGCGRIIWLNVLLSSNENLFWLFCGIVSYDGVWTGRCSRPFHTYFILIQRAILSCNTKIYMSVISIRHLNSFHELGTLVTMGYLCHFGSHASRLRSFDFRRR